MVRSPCCEETSELTKGPWSKREDEKLIGYIRKHGHENWKSLPKKAGLNRCGKSCRLRWINYLRPNIKRGGFSDEEEQIIINLHSQIGNKWSRIATYLPGRTDNEIKNYWNTSLRKKLLAIGVDPKTHQPLLNPNPLSNLSLLNFITYPNWYNGLYPTNNLQSPQNLMQMLNQNAFDPYDFLFRYALDPTYQQQLSQSLMQIINPKPFPNLIDSSGGSDDPKQEFFHEINNMVKKTQNSNTLPSVSNPIASSYDCEFQQQLANSCYNNLNTDFIPENETSLPNLHSVETPNILNKVEGNFSPVRSPSSIMFEDWDKFWEDEAM